MEEERGENKKRKRKGKERKIKPEGGKEEQGEDATSVRAQSCLCAQNLRFEITTLAVLRVQFYYAGARPRGGPSFSKQEQLAERKQGAGGGRGDEMGGMEERKSRPFRAGSPCLAWLHRVITGQGGRGETMGLRTGFGGLFSLARGCGGGLALSCRCLALDQCRVIQSAVQNTEGAPQERGCGGVWCLLCGRAEQVTVADMTGRGEAGPEEQGEKQEEWSETRGAGAARRHRLDINGR